MKLQQDNLENVLELVLQYAQALVASASHELFISLDVQVFKLFTA